MALEYPCLSYTQAFRGRTAEELMKRAAAPPCEHHSGPESESIIPEIEVAIRRAMVEV